MRLIKLIMWLTIIFNIFTAMFALMELQSFLIKLWLIFILIIAIHEIVKVSE
jgi:hypothetical protein